MAKIIELTGPPGVGKTTYYDALVSKWGKACAWAPAEFLYPAQKLKYSGAKAFASSLLGKMKRRVDTKAFDEAGKRFVANYPEYVDAVMNDISANKRDVHGKDLRLDDAVFLYTSFKRVQILLEAETSKYALKAEGVVHRLPHSIKDDSLDNDRNVVVSLLSKIPLPAAVIYLTCDVEENAKRLATRKFVWDDHRNLSLTKLKDYSRRSHEKRNMIIEELYKYQVPILKIDTTKNLQESTESILAFINTLASS